MDTVLLKKLTDLRETIKKKDKKAVVCSDDILCSMVNLMPEKITDFKKIRGIGDTFVEKYAQKFLDCIYEHIKSGYKSINNKELELIYKLNNKLVNINQKNRLLYTNRLSKKFAFDLTRINNVNKIIEAFLCESNKDFVIAKVSYDKLKNTKSTENFYDLKALYREVETIKVEKGQEILYLGYPYVEGKLFNDFKIKAPLILFPAEIELINNEYRLKFDNTRDILYNSTLIIAYHKFNNKNEVIIDEVIEEISQENYLKEAINYFAKYQVMIEEKDSIEIESFTETSNYDNDKLQLKGYCILGAFPTYSNSLQRDYNHIINNKIINNLVRELFIAYDNTENQVNKELKQDILEEDIYYINEVNHSQEMVLSMIDKEDALVIQGPPGTGKSQTITSLIAQAVLHDKKVLVVSEKKTALDVIYNRLGKISDFVMFIDDPNNKEAFYQQLSSLLELDDELHVDLHKIKEKGKEITLEIEKLQELESLLDTKTSLNASLRDLYQNSNRLDFDDEEIKVLYKEVSNKLTKNTYTLEQLLKLRQMFRDTELYNNLCDYKKYIKYEKVYAYFKPNILETELHISPKDFYEIPFYINLYNKFGFITKMRLNYKNQKIVKTINSLVTKIGGKQRKKIKRLLYDDVDLVINAINVYPQYIFNKNLYESLSKLEQQYFEYCFALSKRMKIDFCKINEYLIDIFTTVEIMNYEQKYSNILITSERYKDIRTRISELSKEKKQLTFECLYNYLQSKINEVFNMQSKRLNELKRKCDSKRKWSINKLINEFKLELFNGIYVWLLTPEGVSELMPINQTLFDLIIFDEASQMYIENAIPI
ncbi:MAG TPA: AAA domain-containing protein, partial [Haloplasmataceae bacterium]